MQLESQYRGRVSFIHNEVYVDNDVNKGLRPQLRAFHLQTEPWLFTFNRQGRIAARLEGAFGIGRCRLAGSDAGMPASRTKSSPATSAEPNGSRSQSAATPSASRREARPPHAGPAYRARRANTRPSTPQHHHAAYANGRPIDPVTYAMLPHDLIVIGYGRRGSFSTSYQFGFPAGE
jgi:hypothetical protein